MFKFDVSFHFRTTISFLNTFIKEPHQLRAYLHVRLRFFVILYYFKYEYKYLLNVLNQLVNVKHVFYYTI